MTFEYVSYASGANISSNITLNWPVASAVGDIGFAMVSRALYEEDANSKPTGWTELQGRVSRTDYEPSYISVFYRVKQLGDTDVTWGWSTSRRVHAHLSVFRGGFDSGDPVRDSSSNRYISNNAIAQGSSVDAVVNSPLVVMPVTYGLVQNAIVSAPGGWTLEEQSYSAVSDMSMRPAHAISSVSGSTGDINIGLSLSSSDKHAYLISLNTSTGNDARRFYFGRPI